MSGTILDQNGNVIPGASIFLKETSHGTVSDVNGAFQLRLPPGKSTLIFSHIQFVSKEVKGTYPEDTELTVVLEERTEQLGEVEVSDTHIQEESVLNVQKISAKSAKGLPSTFGDFNKVLVTLPGVSSNNELSSAYSVRGGNFAENLVYVNDIPVYRPFLTSSGQQEGLSFVNPDMVEDIEFYAGGWEPKYGDKLSSSLNISYKEPDSLEGAVTVGLLGGTAYAGGKTERMSYLVGARYRDSRYLLNTLEVSGQYFPTYTDVQAFFTFDLSRKGSNHINKTKLNLLMSYGRNRYLSEPESQSTDFGTVSETLRLQTAFEGREIMRYDTYQTGFRLTHRFSERIRSHFIGSALFTTEKEQYDVEGAYRLCDVDTNPTTTSFDECVVVKGIGSNYEYGRNSLDAEIFTVENRWEVLLNNQNVLEAGAGVTFQTVDDELNEYSFVDSADYVELTSSIFNSLSIDTRQYYAYVQNTAIWADSIHALSSGIRMTYWDYNGQVLVSPRISYRWAPKWQKKTTFKLSTGFYQQPPFYRELRGYDGELRENVKAQRSVHFILGSTRLFQMWGRSFLFTTDVYYKLLYNLIPYDIDDLRIRYYPDLTAHGYAAGIDFRVYGEFVKGTQSWFSLGLLNTKEDVKNDGRGYIRRPMDQHINLAAYFEDHMPGDPSLRIYLNMVFGSGYPFGPPNRLDLRNFYQGDEYYRVDIGLSKMFDFSMNHFFNKLWVRLEVLNALGADNTLSYTWIADVSGNQYAVPNSLSARFLNIKLSAEL